MEKKEDTLKKVNKNNKLRNKNILMDKMANEWLEIASKLENPKPLFGNIWHQGEVGVLFANTGKGKSILAVQLADAISKGQTLLDTKIREHKVLYFDFELSTKAFQQRYSTNNTELYSFSNNFIRVEIDRTVNFEHKDFSFEQLVIESIKTQVDKNKAEVLIIDNITFLAASNEKSHEALALMKLILDISRKENVSILLIAHTPKRDIYSPIQLEDLAGSKALSNFIDVCFCIGESVQGDNIRYIKQLKNRNYPIEYGQENVINCELIKEKSFLKLNTIDFGTEKSHLQNDNGNKRVVKAQNLKDSGKTNIEIAEILGVSARTVGRWLKPT
jgi:predicted ATP-dependent serine protease